MVESEVVDNYIAVVRADEVSRTLLVHESFLDPIRICAVNLKIKVNINGELEKEFYKGKNLKLGYINVDPGWVYIRISCFPNQVNNFWKNTLRLRRLLEIS